MSKVYSDSFILELKGAIERFLSSDVLGWEEDEVLHLLQEVFVAGESAQARIEELIEGWGEE